MSYLEVMRCDECGTEYDYCYMVPQHVWNKIAPREMDNRGLDGLLCIQCASRKAREAGIQLRFQGLTGWWIKEEGESA